MRESSPIGVNRETDVPTLLLLAFCMMMEEAWWQEAGVADEVMKDGLWTSAWRGGCFAGPVGFWGRLSRGLTGDVVLVATRRYISTVGIDAR